NDALYHKNYTEALALTRQALKLYPKQPWLIQILFDLETRKEEWIEAEKTLKRGEKLGVFDTTTARQHTQALLLARASIEKSAGYNFAAMRKWKKAFVLNAAWTPAVLKRTEALIDGGKHSAALRTLNQGWAENPHPTIALLYLSLMPVPKKTKS